MTKVALLVLKILISVLLEEKKCLRNEEEEEEEGILVKDSVTGRRIRAQEGASFLPITCNVIWKD